MDQVPVTFNFNESAILVQKQKEINAIAELAKVRAYVHGQYQKYIEKNHDYFVIDLTEHKHHVRAIIIRELLPRFPDIGYASAVRNSPFLNNPPEKELTVLETISPAHTGTRSRSYINRINPDQIIPMSEQYVIACSKEFVKEMTNYWIRG
jgi:hypothetical protein